MSRTNSRVEAPASIGRAVATLGPGALRETALVKCVHPLFSRILASRGQEIYLANHSLGRPLDRVAEDVAEALAHWYGDLDGAWDCWLRECEAFRAALATLIHAPQGQCIVPKTSAGQGLRAVLNCFDRPLAVLSTRDEFGSVDHILKTYAERGRITLAQVPPRDDGQYYESDLAGALNRHVDLLVVSLVMYSTGQWLDWLPGLLERARRRGTRVLVDLYHAAGIVPADVQELDADFAIGGCYKYLRGGPGAGWLYIHPRQSETLKTLDTGWFAQPEPFAFARPAVPALAPGGDGFLESTPSFLAPYQARSGLQFTLAMGVGRLRAYSLEQLAKLREALAVKGLKTLEVPRHGAFLVMPFDARRPLPQELAERGVNVDAREGRLRLCPDLLNTAAELEEASEIIAAEVGNR